MNEEKLTFRLTNDNRPLREQSLEDSILTEQYKYALRQINEYLGELELENFSETCHDGSRGKEQQRSEAIGSDTDYNNNIFAFIGDRGSGKTSCMITVADFLIRKNDVFNSQEYPYINKYNFATIDLIDPVYFDESHNLISLFLAKLYKSFRKKTEEYERDVRNYYDKRELSENIRNKFLERFRRTQENLLFVMDVIKYDNNQDLLEFVDGLSASVNLKENIKELVDLYLEYIGMKNTVLILRIDDVDLNEKHAGKMAEAMRKYFIQPNILVLLSLKLKQLEEIKFLELRDFYKEDNSLSNDELRDMVDKYMVKLIPRSHRIFMPQHENYRDKKLIVEYYNLFVRGVEDKKKFKPLEFASVRQAVPQLIFWKTRYLFYNSHAHESYIVPENLRELRQLIKLMVVLPDYRIYEKDAEGIEKVKHTNSNNKTIFKNYFFETWLSNNLPADHRNDALRIVNEGTNNNINALVLNLLKNRYESVEAAKQKYIESSPSFGEVVAYIHQIEKKVSLPEDCKLLFFIKSLYSIKLYEAYDNLTEDENDNTKNSEEEILMPDDSILKPYQLLTKGSIFSAEKEFKNLFYEVEKDDLKKLIKDCVDSKNTLPTYGAPDYEVKLKLLQMKCQWVELLMLCCHNVDEKNYGFDVGDLFYNLPFMMSNSIGLNNIDGGEDLWRIIQDEKRGFKTLRDEFKTSTITHRLDNNADKYSIHRWQSFCTIRNVEILEGFLTITKRAILQDITRGYENLLQFFNKAAEFSVKSYDRDERMEKERNSINFKFLEKVTELLNRTNSEGYEELKESIEKLLKIRKTVSGIESADQPVRSAQPAPTVPSQ